MSINDLEHPSVGLRNGSLVQQPDPVPDYSRSVFSDTAFGAGTDDYKPDPTSVESARRIAGLFLKEGELQEADSNAFLLNQDSGQNRRDALLGSAAHMLEQMDHSADGESTAGLKKHAIIVVENPEEMALYMRQAQKLGFKFSAPGQTPENEPEQPQQPEKAPSVGLAQAGIVPPVEDPAKPVDKVVKAEEKPHEKGFFESIRDWIVEAYHYVANGFSHDAPAAAAQPSAPKPQNSPQKPAAAQAPSKAPSQSKGQAAAATQKAANDNIEVANDNIKPDPSVPANDNQQAPAQPNGAQAQAAQPQAPKSQAPSNKPQAGKKQPNIVSKTLDFVGDRLQRLSHFDGSPESLVRSGLFDFPEPKKSDPNGPNVAVLQEILAQLKAMNELKAQGVQQQGGGAAPEVAQTQEVAKESPQPAKPAAEGAKPVVEAAKPEARAGDVISPDKINVSFVPPGGKLPEKPDQPSITFVTYDQLAELLKNSNPNDIAMVGCDKAERLMSNPDAREAMKEFTGNRVYATAHSTATLENMVEFESLLRDNREVVTPGELVKRFHEADLKSPISDAALKNMGVDPESSVITDLDKFKKGVIRAEVLADMGVEEKDGVLQVTSPEQFAKSAQERAMQRLASGGATAVETEYLGEVSPVMVVTPDPALKLDEATQAITDHKPRVTLTPIPAQADQLQALNEYARADAIADRVISGIENGENIVLYANQERVAAPALQDKEPWKDILIDGKIPTISDVVLKKVEEHAASHPDFAAKLGTVHNLDLLSTPRDMALAARDFDTPPNKVVAADSVDGPSHSSLVIADPAIAHRADFSKTQEEANPTSVIIAGVSSKLPSEYVVEMARSTSQPGAVTPSKCEMAFTDSEFDKKQQKDLSLKLSVSEAAGNTVAGAMAGKMEESLGIPQSNPLRQSAAVSMPHGPTPANDNVVGAKI